MSPRSFHYDGGGRGRHAAPGPPGRPERAHLRGLPRADRDLPRPAPAGPQVRVAVITGTGKAFCTGGDVKDIIGDLRDDATARRSSSSRTMTCDLIRAMRAAAPARSSPR